jgi:hypothetical protein
VTSLVAGVLALNVLLLAIGYCVLSVSLAGSRVAVWASYAGVALLTGAGLTGVGVFFAAIAGFTTGVSTFAVVGALIALAGLAILGLAPSRARAWLAAPPAPEQAPMSSRARTVALVAGFGVVAISLFALVGGFRSSPWLDDVWGIWLPKGVALDALGLDTRLFTDSGDFFSFEVLDYPLWWSILINLDLRFVGSIDLRAANAQLTLLAIAFLGSAGRLLWGHVRPWVLAGTLLLLSAAPEFFRHAQGAIADLPLAMYLSLYLLAILGWLATRRGFYLLLAFAFAVAALEIKSEGFPQLLIILGVVSVAAWWTARGALPALLITSAAAVLTTLPWLAWRLTHDVESQVALGDALDPGYLLDRTERVGPSIEAIARHVADPGEWLLLVPLVAVLGVVGAVRTGRVLWLTPTALLAAVFAFWIWAYWAESESLDYLLATSSYRIADSLVLLAWVLLSVQGEMLLSRERDRHTAAQTASGNVSAGVVTSQGTLRTGRGLDA